MVRRPIISVEQPDADSSPKRSRGDWGEPRAGSARRVRWGDFRINRRERMAQAAGGLGGSWRIRQDLNLEPSDP